tara:strand:+ start:1279 stop:1536 length:258 start_codon:yes stop_codon:yes gene_type:complete
MPGIASQSKSLATGEVFELPPYADNILIEAASNPNVETSPDGTTFYDTTLTALVSGTLYSVDETIFPHIKCTDKAITVHYRVSKR